jgi:hypothetical protein
MVIILTVYKHSCSRWPNERISERELEGCIQRDVSYYLQSPVGNCHLRIIPDLRCSALWQHFPRKIAFMKRYQDLLLYFQNLKLQYCYHNCPQRNLILKLSIPVPITKYSTPKAILNVYATIICRIAWINFAISTRSSARLHGVSNKTLEPLSASALLKFVWVFDFWLKMENCNGYLTWNHTFLHAYWAKNIKHLSE